ncbi:DEAD/DEAH box helicase [Ornithinimicrobium cerasi]|uniref:DEAD/DEAH box helicase n=1 Tax=Ornithinimicrobium cerasi TaxID=2248773 RepID=UPI001F299771|nr:DEAD/DEAH box helicase [Ornithinimicrobium cerasi]
MPPDLAAASWVLRVSRSDLADAVGIATLTRGEGYAADGRVRTLVTALDGGTLLGTVLGSRRTVYQTIVRRIGADGPGWVGQCSCPVGYDCKHAVAVVVETQRRLSGAGARSGWETALAPLVRAIPGGAAASGGEGASDAAGRDTVALALEVSVGPGLAVGGESARVLLRPVREGRGGRWVRTGVSWRHLSSAWASPEVLPHHRSVVGQLMTVARGSGGHTAWGADQLGLDDLGPVAWPLLQQCVAAGVELVPGTALTAVAVRTDPVTVTLDLSRHGSGALVLRPGLSADPPPQVGGRQFLLGNPPHGVGHLADDGLLSLWPLREPPPPSAVPLLERADPLEVPVEEVPRFLALYRPVLSRVVTLSSADGSVPPLEPTRPTLLLRLTPRPSHQLLLEWAFRYAVPGTPDPSVTTVALDDHGQPRDTEGEAAVTDTVLPVLEQLPGLVDRSARPRPRPYPTVTITGGRTARFVEELLPRLRELSDVEVLVEGELPDYGEAEEAPVVRLSTTQGEVEDWFDLHVQVTVGDQQVPFEELFAALARGDEVMLLESGTWFTLDRPELQSLRTLIDEARDLEDGPPRPGRVSVTAYQAGLWEEFLRLGIVEEQDDAWRRSVDGLLQLGGADLGLVQQPAGLRAQLRPYQLEGHRWLSTLWDARLGGVLADDMGLGKTLQALAMITRAEDRGDLAEGPVLVVAPTSVVSTWAEETARFAPHLRVATVTATARRRGSDLATAVGAADVVVTSYTLLRLESEGYEALPWSGVVLDEAQFVKNYRSATYQAVRRVCGPRTFVITGTPLENNLMDLWSMTSLAAPGLFPRPEVFTHRYRRPIEAGDSPEVLDRLRRRLRPFMLRRTKSQVATELPPKIEQTLHVALHPAHQKVYDRHLQRERQRVLGLLEDLDRNRVAIFRALTVLRQLALDPSLVSEEHTGLATSAKISSLVEQLTELAAEGHRALVFSSFTGFLAKVRLALGEAGIGHSYLDGSTRGDVRASRISGFREGDDPVFLISLKAGGFGLTLTEADYVFVLDPWWNPAAEAQAVDRTHRIGQTRPVNVYRMVSTGTIEEKVVALQQRKRDLFATVVDAGEFRAGGISAEDIRDLLDG